MELYRRHFPSLRLKDKSREVSSEHKAGCIAEGHREILIKHKLALKYTDYYPFHCLDFEVEIVFCLTE